MLYPISNPEFKGSNKAIKILIADDEPIILRMLEIFFAKKGYDIVLALNGLEAWEEMQKPDPPQLMVIDWMMPKLDGLELTRRIRTSNLAHYVYIIMVTAKGEKKDLVQAIDLGVDDYLPKPFNYSELHARVRAGERITNLERTLAHKNKELEEKNIRFITEANNRMKKDLEAAAKIQEALLPKNIPEVEGIKFGWQFKPCTELAGDILNLFWLDNKHIGLFVLDVSGHGLASALKSVTLSYLLSPVQNQSSILRRKIKGSSNFQINSPAKVLHQLNQQFPVDMETGQFFTVIYGILNIETYEFIFSSAGHPDPILIRNSRNPTILKSSNFPIGFTKEVAYNDYKVCLKPGDRLYLYSDGITEARESNGKEFGLNCFVKFLNENRKMSFEDSLPKLLKEVTTWHGNSSLDDDVSLLALEITEIIKSNEIPKENKHQHLLELKN